MNPLSRQLLPSALALLVAWSGGPALLAQTPATQPGLLATYATGNGAAADSAVVPGVALHVAAGQSVSPLLAPGPFTVTWEGFLSVDLRSDYQFAAEVNGKLKVEINGAPVLEAIDAAGKPSEKIRLNKGTNIFKATFTAPPTGDAFVRLRWVPRNLFAMPIPADAFSHAPGAGTAAASVRLGRELVLEHRCVKCHAAGDPAKGAVELTADAPTFNGIGSRRGAAWLVKWIANPAAQRAVARMPQVLHGPTAAADAGAIAAYLASLTDDTKFPPAKDSPDLVVAGLELATKLHCAACHSIPGEKADPAKPALKHLKEKFLPDRKSVV